jgi:outer membrane protein, heavy metal efflux system
MKRNLGVYILTAAILTLGGCATVRKDAEFPALKEEVTGRTGHRIHWNLGGPEDREAAEAVTALLGRDLIAEEAVQIALLNNRRLQAVYEDLGVAQAEMVQAGLLLNPVFTGSIRFGSGGHVKNIELSVAQEFINIFMIPLRKKMAEKKKEAVRVRVAAAVLDSALAVKTAFYRLQGSEQELELLSLSLQAAEASFGMAERLHRAGNITDLQFSREQADHGQALLDVQAMESVVLKYREQLNLLMGLWGARTEWKYAPRLPDLPEADPDLEQVETRAVTASLDLELALRELETSAQKLGLTGVTSMLPTLEAGLKGEREEGRWSLGPSLALPLPLFDQGMPSRSAAEGELRKRWENYYALAVEVRSGARNFRNRVVLARQRAEYQEKVMVPLYRRITEQTLLMYNAMQVGVFDLLRAKRRELEMERRSVRELQKYWIARAELEQLLSGRLRAARPDTSTSPLVDH